MPLPTFIIAGAQKSGTTSLHHLLKLHPSVYFPIRPQELHFFDLDEHFRQGIDWYEKQFSDVRAEHTAVGQTSPLYMYEPRVASRIAAAVPAAKLIFILRNPVERAYSHYWHEVKRGHESLSFEEALEQEARRLLRGAQQRRNFSYADRGYYAEQLERYLQYFPSEQLLLLLTDEMANDPARVIDRCCDFLGIDLSGEEILARASALRRNVSRIPRSRLLQRLTAPWRSRSWLLRQVARSIDGLNLKTVHYPSMKDSTRRRLHAMFDKENQRLGMLFDLDLSLWSIRS